MTKQEEEESKSPQIRPIHRQKIYAGLAIAGFLAIVVSVSNCNNEQIAEEEANETIDATFYQTTAQCEADTKKQQDEYAVLQEKYRTGQLAQQPTPPPINPQDCAPQMLAAAEEHKKTAPVYASVADCQAEGVQCEAIPASEQISGYRPVYGGTYLDTSDPSYTYINYGGSQYLVYETRPVYQSMTPGRVVTPYGREIAQTTTGRVTVPRHTTFAAPSRPNGTAAKGTIRGRSSQGFGSSFKSTGRGGK